MLFRASLLWALLLLCSSWPAWVAAQDCTALLSWNNPTQNTDGSPLTDLAGIDILHGCTVSGEYANVIQIRPAVSSHVVEGLPNGATCFFASRAINQQGVTSVLSNEAVKQCPDGPPIELPGTISNLQIVLRERIDPPPSVCQDCFDFSLGFIPFAQDVDNDFTVIDPHTIELRGDTWLQVDLQAADITATSVLEFEYESTEEGNLQAIGFIGPPSYQPSRMFILYGVGHTCSTCLTAIERYVGPGVKAYSIPIGTFYTGTNLNLVLVNERSGNSTFSNVRLVN